MNEYESESNWRLYAPIEDCVAIKSNIGAIKSSITCEEILYLAKINYYDQTTEVIPDGNTLFLSTHKRKSFEHEREVRLIHTVDLLNSNDSLGIEISVDLSKLISEVIISPLGSNYLLKAAKHILESNLLSDIKCCKSELLTPPY